MSFKQNSKQTLPHTIQQTDIRAQNGIAKKEKESSKHYKLTNEWTTIIDGSKYHTPYKILNTLSSQTVCFQIRETQIRQRQRQEIWHHFWELEPYPSNLEQHKHSTLVGSWRTRAEAWPPKRKGRIQPVRGGTNLQLPKTNNPPLVDLLWRQCAWLSLTVAVTLAHDLLDLKGKKKGWAQYFCLIKGRQSKSRFRLLLYLIFHDILLIKHTKNYINLKFIYSYLHLNMLFKKLIKHSF